MKVNVVSCCKVMPRRFLFVLPNDNALACLTTNPSVGAANKEKVGLIGAAGLIGPAAAGGGFHTLCTAG